MALLKNCISLKNIIIPCAKQILLRAETRNIARWVAPTLKVLKRRRDRLGPEPEKPRSSYLDWNYEAEIHAFGHRLNENFKSNLLRTALTNRSYKNKAENESNTIEDNTKLVQEGEKFITNYLLDYLKNRLPDFPEEGRRSVCDNLMTEQCLSNIAKHIGLTDIVLTAEFPVSDSTLSASFKAVVATLVHSSDEIRGQKFVRDFVVTQLQDKDVNTLWSPAASPMEQLEQLLSKRGMSVPEARLCNASAASTILAAYRVGLYDNKKQLLGIGWGESIEIATDVAARDALARIYGTRENFDFSLSSSNKNQLNV